MELTPQNVTAVTDECLAGAGTVSGVVEVEGITKSYYFHEANLSERSDDIASMLAQLPAEFGERAGGGWSFLNSCQRMDGTLWTGLHSIMEALLVLGLAIGLVEWLLPREHWYALPGQMPYFVVKSERIALPG